MSLKNKKEVVIKPLPFQKLFLSIFLIFNFIGIFNFRFFSNHLDIKPLLFLVFLGLLGFAIGTYLIKRLRIKISPIRGSFKPFRFRFFFFIFLVSSFLLILYTHVISGGIVITLPDKRATILPFTTLIIYTGILSSLLYFSQLLLDKKPLKKFLLLLFIQVILVLSMGYRSPMIVLVGGATIIFFIIESKHKSRIKKILTIKN
jgi:hypothetical protein